MIMTRRNITIAYDPVVAVFLNCDGNLAIRRQCHAEPGRICAPRNDAAFTKEIPFCLDELPPLIDTRAESADLQHGERYTSVDFIFHQHPEVSAHIVSSYDSSCRSPCPCECHKVSFFWFPMLRIFLMVGPGTPCKIVKSSNC
jgi:hypothetical protein